MLEVIAGVMDMPDPDPNFIVGAVVIGGVGGFIIPADDDDWLAEPNVPGLLFACCCCCWITLAADMGNLLFGWSGVEQLAEGSPEGIFRISM